MPSHRLQRYHFFTLPSSQRHSHTADLPWLSFAADLGRPGDIAGFAPKQRHASSVHRKMGSGRPEGITHIPSSTEKQPLASSGQSSLPWLLSRTQGTESPVCLCVQAARVKPSSSLNKRGPFPVFLFSDDNEVPRVHQWFRHILTVDSSTHRAWTICLGPRDYLIPCRLQLAVAVGR